MRILLCVGSLGSGGAERDLANLAPELARRGHEVHLAFFNDGPHRKALEKTKVQLHHLTGLSSYDPRLIVQIARIIDRNRIDVLNTWLTQMDVLGGIAARIQPRARRCAHVITELSSADAYPSTWKHRLRVWVASRADHIIANSFGGRRYWESVVATLGVSVVPNGLPLASLALTVAQPKSDLASSATAKLIVFVGRLHEDKNIELLTHAFSKVVQASDAFALMCGEGPLRINVERIIAQHGTGNRIRLAGFVANVWGVVKAADVFVSVSNFEGRPNALLEAMALGTPLVASDIPAHREILDESTALFADGQSVGDVTSRILEVLRDPVSAGERARRARQRAQTWSLDAMAESYEKVFSSFGAPHKVRKEHTSSGTN